MFIDEVVEMTQTHLSDTREMKTQSQQGRIQTAQSLLDYLQDNHDAEEFNPELCPDDIAKT